MNILARKLPLKEVSYRISSICRPRYLATASGSNTRAESGQSMNTNRTMKNAILTVPNLLSLSRVLATPAMGYFIVSGMTTPAIACVAYGAATDLVDGYLARALKQESRLGTVLDPIADKMMLMTCFACSGYAGLIPLWLAKGVIFRDLGILVVGAYIRYLGFQERPSFSKYFNFEKHPTLGMEPSKLSKVNTAIQCVTLLLALSTQQYKGDFFYDWSIFALHMLLTTTTCVTLAQYTLRLGASPLFKTVYNSKVP